MLPAGRASRSRDRRLFTAATVKKRRSHPQAVQADRGTTAAAQNRRLPERLLRRRRPLQRRRPCLERVAGERRPGCAPQQYFQTRDMGAGIRAGALYNRYRKWAPRPPGRPITPPKGGGSLGPPIFDFQAPKNQKLWVPRGRANSSHPPVFDFLGGPKGARLRRRPLRKNT